MSNILQVVWGDIHFGGVQLLLLDLLSHMNRDNLHIDLYCFGSVASTEIYNRFQVLGVNILTGNHSKYRIQEITADLHAILQKKQYDVVHCNTGGLELTAATMRAARRHRVPVRIAHSHNAKQNELSYAKRERLWQFMNRRLSTARLACSEQAAEHLFGKSGAKRCLVLKNGIVPADYRFNGEIRQHVRRELGLENALIIGHVGRMEKQKNHAFLLRVFAQIQQRRQDAVLLLIGDGSLMDKVKEQAKQLGIFESVRFLGVTTRVNEYLQAMDAFVFPSLFEGLGIAVIEAQTADVPIVCSEMVPAEAAVTPRFHSLPLTASPAEWCEVILQAAGENALRADRSDDIRAAGYDIIRSAEQLFYIYQSNLKQ